MANYLSQKTVFELDPFNPIRNLWRNVLIACIEDALKEAHIKIRFNLGPEKRWENIEYFTDNNVDLNFICESAGLSPVAIKRNVSKLLEDIENRKPVNLPWKRLSTTNPANF